MQYYRASIHKEQYWSPHCTYSLHFCIPKYTLQSILNKESGEKAIGYEVGTEGYTFLLIQYIRIFIRNSFLVNSLLQQGLRITVQLAPQSMVAPCWVGSPLALALGQPVNTSGGTRPVWWAWEWMKTVFTYETRTKSGSVVGNMALGNLS